MIIEWYRGHRVIRWKERFYAFERTDARFDPNGFEGDGKRFEGASLDDIKRQFDIFMEPEVVARGYLGYDIIRVGQDFHGIKQNDGGFSLRRVHMGSYHGYVHALSLEEIKTLLNQLAKSPPSGKPGDPVLVEQGFKGFNLVRYGEKIYAIPQNEGAFRIRRIIRNKYSQWFSGNSLEEVRKLVKTPGAQK